MKLTDIIKVIECKDARGKKTGQWLVTIGQAHYGVSANSREAALADFMAKMENYDEESYSRRYFKTDSGEFLCLYRTFHGWQYDIVRFKDGSEIGPGQCGTNMMGADDKEQAVAAVRRHVAQYNESAAKEASRLTPQLETEEA